MNKIIVLSTLFAVGSADAAVTLSNPALVPSENVAIKQSDHSGTANQIRNRGATDIQFITQTFVWNSPDAFDGIGFYLDGGNDSYWTAGDSQNYTFVIQELGDGLGSPPTRTMYEANFSLTGNYVADGRWLYLDTDNVALQNGTTYGFALSAATNDTALMRTVVTTAAGDAYPPGLARLTGDNWGESGALKTVAYNTGTSVNDYTFYLTHTPPTVLSNPGSVPDFNVVVSQLDSSGDVNVQARQRGPGATGDWRAITETFQWTTTNAFDGIGLFMGAGNDALWSSTSTQTYQFVIQAVDSNNVPTSTVLNSSFYLTGDNVADGQWLYIDTPDVNLESNKWYGFSLAPPTGATDSGLRTYWDTASGDVYAGLARQYNPASGGGIPKTDSYAAGGGVPDFTFYLLQAAGANDPATIVDWSSLSGNVMKMVVYVPGSPGNYHPESVADLVSGTWINVPHSIDGFNPFIQTNLDYSTVASNGADRVIYVKAEDSTGFFKVIGESQ